MQSSTTILRISWPIPELESALINDWENVIAYCEESQQSEVYMIKSDLFQLQLCGLWGSATSGKTPPEFTLTQNCCINMNIDSP